MILVISSATSGFFAVLAASFTEAGYRIEAVLATVLFGLFAAIAVREIYRP